MSERPRQADEALDALAARLAGVVGEEHVERGEAERDRRSRDTIPWRSTCALAVRPGSTEEVREVLRLAREAGVPAWPYSTGKNWGYGATMATHEGALVLVLDRMNRILEVNEDLAYAVIEPGVTQGQLHAHLEAAGSRLWIDCTDSTPQASVIGNALERGVGYTPYGDHYGQLCGLQVVLPDGGLLEGEGGFGGVPLQTCHTHPRVPGPAVEGLFSQSNLGVVTRGGVWLMPRPERVLGFFLEVRREEDLPGALEAVRELSLQGVVNSNIHTVNDFLFSTLLEPFPFERAAGRSRLDEPELRELMSRYRLAPWNLGGALYGTRSQVRAAARLVRRRLRRFGRLRFLDDFRIGLIERALALRPALRDRLVPAPRRRMFEAVRETYGVFNGRPTEFFVSRWEYYKSRRGWPERDVDPARDGDGTGLIWFPPLAPLQGGHVLRILRACRPAFEERGFNFSSALVMVNPRTVIVLMQIFFDRENPEEARRAIELHAEISEGVAAMGYLPYRGSVATMERLAASNPARSSLLDRIKESLDPDNYLAPGRYGVRPRGDLIPGRWRTEEQGGEARAGGRAKRNETEEPQ